MKIAIGTPVSGRPYYLKQMLESWSVARGVEDVQFVFSLEPVGGVEDNLSLIYDFYFLSRAKCHIILNNEIQGPAKNHYVALQTASKLDGIDHIILAEEDIIVSDDVLEYQRWGHEVIENQDNANALVCSYSTEDNGARSEVRSVEGFPNCWLWGTSCNWWRNFIGPNWDSDFSTGEGNEKGWDWNLARVMKSGGLSSLQPTVSRAQNIGEIGWSTGPGSVVKVPTFSPHQEPTEFKII